MELTKKAEKYKMAITKKFIESDAEGRPTEVRVTFDKNGQRTSLRKTLFFDSCFRLWVKRFDVKNGLIEIEDRFSKNQECCLCQEELTKLHEKHNPWPLSKKEKDLCCKDCNKNKVIPERLKLLPYR